MDLELWKKRVRRIAVAEREFVRMHPEIEPHFFNLLSAAVDRPRASTRGVRLAPYISPRVPLLGPRVWVSVDLHFRQQLAPHFLEAWDAWSPDGVTVPDLSERPDL
jgi:hypothetical protein